MSSDIDDLVIEVEGNAMGMPTRSQVIHVLMTLLSYLRQLGSRVVTWVKMRTPTRSRVIQVLTTLLTYLRPMVSRVVRWAKWLAVSFVLVSWKLTKGVFQWCKARRIAHKFAVCVINLPLWALVTYTVAESTKQPGGLSLGYSPAETYILVLVAGAVLTLLCRADLGSLFFVAVFFAGELLWTGVAPLLYDPPQIQAIATSSASAQDVVYYKAQVGNWLGVSDHSRPVKAPQNIWVGLYRTLTK